MSGMSWTGRMVESPNRQTEGRNRSRASAAAAATLREEHAPVHRPTFVSTRRERLANVLHPMNYSNRRVSGGPRKHRQYHGQETGLSSSDAGRAEPVISTRDIQKVSGSADFFAAAQEYS